MKKAINIAVCGIVPHVGTTTTAFQLMGYLNIKNLDVAYVDAKGSNYIENLTKLYSGIERSNKLVKYENYNMYKSILDVDEDYDYIIKDYGCIKSDNFNKVSFFEQDIQIVVAGIKADEIFEINEILKNSEFDKAKIIFNFVPFEQREDVLEQMEERRDKCSFLSYSPDPFSFDGSNTKGFRLIIDEIKNEKRVTSFDFRRKIKSLKSYINLNKKRIYMSIAFVSLYTLALYLIFRGF